MKKVLQLSFLFLVVGQAANAQIGARVKAPAVESIHGIWENSEFGFTMVLMLMENGSGEFDGEVINYSTAANSLIVRFPSGTTTYQYQVNANQLTLSGGDLDGPIVFKKSGSGEGAMASQAVGSPKGAAGSSASIFGRWENQGQVLNFQPNNKVLIDGNSFDYQTQGSIVILSTPQGAVQFQYQRGEGSLTLTGPGGSLVYRELGDGEPVASGQNGNAVGGSTASELAGKWCYVNVTSTGSGGWMTDECITLNENGTYEFYSENSGSATVTNQYGGQVAFGGTSSQNQDAGTWQVQGNSLIAQSRSGGRQTFSLEKRNHPTNGDPMIVLNGRTYVTHWQKAPWQ